MRGILVTGTDTGVGKTFITYNIARGLRAQGVKVACFKPVETGVEEIPQDGEMLARATGQEIDEVVLYRAEKPLAPYSAMLEGDLVISIEKIMDRYRELRDGKDVVLVEGAGGIAVPIVRDYTYANLARDLDTEVLIVARAGLGTINHSVLTVEYARKRNLHLTGLILNMYTGKDPSEKTNPEVIYQMTGLKPLIIRKYESKKIEEPELSALLDLIGF